LTSPHAKPISVSVSGSRAVQRNSKVDSGILLGALVLIGFSAVIAQVVLMRELMVVFCGNELSLGLMLASWLLWTAAGSAVMGRFAVRADHSRHVVAGLQILVAVAFPCAIWMVRASKSVFQTVPGELLGPGPMILTSFLVLSIFCFASGALFAAGSRLYAEAAGTSSSASSSQVYLLEAAGSGLGGILASLLLIRYLRPFEIAALVSVLNLLAAASLTVRVAAWRRAILAALAAIFVILTFSLGSPRLELTSLARLWRGYDLVSTQNSVYGNLAVVQTGGIRTLFENGLVAFHAPDPQAAEEAVHFALLQHPWPRSLLLVGGGINGSLVQALQHPSVERIDYVELDPAILTLAQEYFPTESTPLRNDPHVHVHTTDGRLYLKTTALKFDVIVVNLPDPQTAQLNRFYTLEFFREVGARLNPGGVFSFQLKGAEDYIGPELAEFLRCIHSTLRQAFPEVVTIPGDTVHFFASPQPESLTVDPAELVARLRARNIHTAYVREYYLPYRMAPDRMLDLETQLRAQRDVRINRDFTPVAYYFDVALWSTRFNRAYRRVFQSLGSINFGPLLAAAGFSLFLVAALLRWAPFPRDRWRATSAFSIAAMGFTVIGLEMLLLLGFQAIYGYVYQQLAIIIAGFMVGMALGSWWGIRRAASPTMRPIEAEDCRRLLALQFLAALSPLLLYLLLQMFAATLRSSTLFVVSQIIFPLLAVVFGLLGGYQFPVASRIFSNAAKNEASSPGTLYAFDLLGACLGALLLSSYLIPVFGFQQTAWLMAVVNLAPALLVALLIAGRRAVPA